MVSWCSTYQLPTLSPNAEKTFTHKPHIHKISLSPRTPSTPQHLSPSPHRIEHFGFFFFSPPSFLAGSVGRSSSEKLEKVASHVTASLSARYQRPLPKYERVPSSSSSSVAAFSSPCWRIRISSRSIPVWTASTPAAQPRVTWARLPTGRVSTPARSAWGIPTLSAPVGHSDSCSGVNDTRAPKVRGVTMRPTTDSSVCVSMEFLTTYTGPNKDFLVRRYSKDFPQKWNRQISHNVTVTQSL